MSTGILLLAHAPLASALRTCALHVYPDAAANFFALDVQPSETPEAIRAQALHLLGQLTTAQTLILSDVYGATPCNVAQQVVDDVYSQLVVGVNLPMLLRAINYRHEALNVLVPRVVSGGAQGIMQVAATQAHNRTKESHEYSHCDH